MYGEDEWEVEGSFSIRDYLEEKWELIKSGDWRGLLEDKKFVGGVLAIVLLIAGGLLLLGGQQTQSAYFSESQVPSVHVCVFMPDGTPIPNATIAYGLTSAKTGENGCAYITETNRIRVSLEGFETYVGPPKEKITLEPLLPTLTIKVVGSNGDVEIVRDGDVIWKGGSGTKLFLVPEKELEHGNYIYPKGAVARLVEDGEVVDEKPLPEKGGELVLMPPKEVSFKGAYDVLVNISYDGDYEEAILSVKNSSGGQVFFDTGLPPFKLSLPIGSYTFTVLLEKGGNIFAKAEETVYVDGKKEITIADFQPVSFVFINVKALKDGTLYVVKNGTVVQTISLSQGETKKVPAPKGSKLYFISDDKQDLEEVEAEENVEVGASKLPVYNLHLKVQMAGSPAPRAMVTFYFGPVKLFSYSTDERGEILVKLPKAVYKVCAAFKGISGCERIELFSDKTVTLDIASLGTRTLHVTLNGEPVNGKILIKGVVYKIVDGTALIPNGTFEATIITDDGKAYRAVIKADDTSLELSTGISSQGYGTLKVDAPIGTVFTVKNGLLEETFSMKSGSMTVSLPEGDYKVIATFNGAVEEKFVQIKVNETTSVSLFEEMNETNEETYTVTIRVINNPSPVHLEVLGPGYSFEGAVSDELVLELKEGPYIVKGSIPGKTVRKIFYVPKVTEVTLDLNNPKPSLNLKILNLRGEEVIQAEKGKTYVLRVEVYSPGEGTLYFEKNEVKVREGTSTLNFLIEAKGSRLSAKVRLEYEGKELTKAVSVPISYYEIYCLPSGICFGSTVSGKNYRWTILNRSGKDLYYQVLSGSDLVADIGRLSIGGRYSGSLDVFLFTNGATHHLFLPDNTTYEDIFDPISPIFGLPHTGILQVDTEKVPPIPWPVNLTFSSDHPFKTVNVYAEGEKNGAPCSVDIQIKNKKFYKKPKEGGGYLYYANIEAEVDPDGCETVTFYVYSKDGGIRPASASVEVESSPIEIATDPEEIGPETKVVTLSLKNYLPTPVGVVLDTHSIDCNLTAVLERNVVGIAPGGEAEVNLYIDSSKCKGKAGELTILAETNGGYITGEKNVPFKIFHSCISVVPKHIILQNPPEDAVFSLVNKCSEPLKILSVSNGWRVESNVIEPGKSINIEKKENDTEEETVTITYRVGTEKVSESLDLKWYRAADFATIETDFPENLEELYNMVSFPPATITVTAPLDTKPTFKFSVEFNYEACVSHFEDLFKMYHIRRDPKRVCNFIEKDVSNAFKGLKFNYEENEPGVYGVWLTQIGPASEWKFDKYLYLRIRIVFDVNGAKFALDKVIPVTWEPSVDVEAKVEKNDDTREVNVVLGANYPYPVSVPYEVVVRAPRDGGVFVGTWESTHTFTGHLRAGGKTVLSFKVEASNNNYVVEVKVGKFYNEKGEFSYGAFYDENIPFTVPPEGEIDFDTPKAPEEPGDKEVIKGNDVLTRCGKALPVAYVAKDYLPYTSSGEINDGEIYAYEDKLINGSQPSFLLFDRNAVERLGEKVLEDANTSLEALKKAISNQSIGSDCSGILSQDISFTAIEKNENEFAKCCQKYGLSSLCGEVARYVEKVTKAPIYYVDEGKGFVALVNYNFEEDNYEVVKVLEELNDFAKHYRAFWQLFFRGATTGNVSYPVVLSKNKATVGNLYFFSCKGCSSVKPLNGKLCAKTGRDGKVYGYVYGASSGEVEVNATCEGQRCTFYRGLENEQGFEFSSTRTFALVEPVGGDKLSILFNISPKLYKAGENGNELDLLLDPESLKQTDVEPVSKIVLHIGEKTYEFNLDNPVVVPVGWCLVPKGNLYSYSSDDAYQDGNVTFVTVFDLESTFNALKLGSGIGEANLVPIECNNGEWYAFENVESYVDALRNYYLPHDPKGLAEALNNGYPEVKFEPNIGYFVVLTKEVGEVGRIACKKLFTWSSGWFGYIAVADENGRYTHRCEMLDGNAIADRSHLFCYFLQSNEGSGSKEENKNIGGKIYEYSTGEKNLWTDQPISPALEVNQCTAKDFETNWIKCTKDSCPVSSKVVKIVQPSEKGESEVYYAVVPEDYINHLDGGFIQELNIDEVNAYDPQKKEIRPLYFGENRTSYEIVDGDKITWHDTRYRYRLDPDVQPGGGLIFFTFTGSSVGKKVDGYAAYESANGKRFRTNFIVFYLGGGKYGALLDKDADADSAYLYFNTKEGETCDESAESLTGGTCTGMYLDKQKGLKRLFRLSEKVVYADDRPGIEKVLNNSINNFDRVKFALDKFLRNPKEPGAGETVPSNAYLLGFATVRQLKEGGRKVAPVFIEKEDPWNFKDGINWYVTTTKAVNTSDDTIVPVLGSYSELKQIGAVTFDPKELDDSEKDFLEQNFLTHEDLNPDNVNSFVTYFENFPDYKKGKDINVFIRVYKPLIYLGEDWAYYIISDPGTDLIWKEQNCVDKGGIYLCVWRNNEVDKMTSGVGRYARYPALKSLSFDPNKFSPFSKKNNGKCGMGMEGGLYPVMIGGVGRVGSYDEVLYQDVILDGRVICDKYDDGKWDWSCVANYVGSEGEAESYETSPIPNSCCTPDVNIPSYCKRPIDGTACGIITIEEASNIDIEGVLIRDDKGEKIAYLLHKCG